MTAPSLSFPREPYWRTSLTKYVIKVTRIKFSCRPATKYGDSGKLHTVISKLKSRHHRRWSNYSFKSKLLSENVSWSLALFKILSGTGIPTVGGEIITFPVNFPGAPSYGSSVQFRIVGYRETFHNNSSV